MTWLHGEYQAKQQRADEKKTRILQAALELFSTKGFHAVTAKMIAAHAGVATGSFYRYFRDKQAVFMAVCLRNEEEMRERIFGLGQRLRQEGQSEQEVLKALISFSVASHREHRGFHKEVLALQYRDPDVASCVRKREETIRRTLVKFMESVHTNLRVRDLDAAAEIVHAVIEEVSHRAVLFDSSVGEERLVREAQAMLTRYLFT